MLLLTCKPECGEFSQLVLIHVDSGHDCFEALATDKFESEWDVSVVGLTSLLRCLVFGNWRERVGGSAAQRPPRDVTCHEQGSTVSPALDTVTRDCYLQSVCLQDAARLPDAAKRHWPVRHNRLDTCRPGGQGGNLAAC